jgi:3-oxoadipate enol-lactonase
VPTLSLPDATLDHDLHGDDGPAVVQLHGLTSSRQRDAVLRVDVATGLPGCRVLRYDARGHGRSTGPSAPEAYTWPALAEDLLRLLEAVFPGEPVHGVGPSMGTGTLLHAVLREPARFAGLSLLIPPAAWGTRTAQARVYEENARLVETEGADALVRAGLDAPRPPAVSPAVPITRPDVAESLLPTLYRGAARTDLPPPGDLASLPVPTLVLGWADDPAHPLSTAARLAGLMPRARLTVAEDPTDVAGWRDRVALQVAEAHLTAPAARGGDASGSR